MQRAGSTATEVFHVNGGQSTNERAEALATFREASAAIITNARCLTEGIDVPAIDCVYFCDPRYSKIDIVQASGRALRHNRAAKKKCGYIVVPIFHSHKDNLDAAIESGAFRNLVSVVRALADQDSRIEEEIRQISFGEGRRKVREQRIKIDFGSAKLIRLEGLEEKLRRSIFTQVIQRAIVPWRPFEQARTYVRRLGLKSEGEWRAYLKNGLKPKDIVEDALRFNANHSDAPLQVAREC